MDRICGAVLEKIRQASPAGRYVIIAEDEFIETLPEGTEFADGDILRALTFLKGEGYIDVKYSRGDMYCVAPIKEFEEDEIDEVEYVPAKRKLFDPVFVSAFLGGALGSLIISLIFAVV